MKIDVTKALSLYGQPKPTSSQAAQDGVDFAALLGQAPKPQPQPLESGANLLPKFDLIGQLQASQATKTNSSPYTAAEDIERLLSLMDNYSQALANPANSLKDLDPLADDLGLMAQELGQKSQKLSPDDPLRALSSDTASLAMVEALKFKRGDYL
ncbi:MAG: hypothetical protein LBR11_04195 [Deltaproteobacteria bacterium]|jgi:hypothetical protein|nr:hypothetical protein [Deltaproteobacteria bacterium]